MIIGLLIVSVGAMLFFTILNIILRQFQETLLWVEPMVRHLVFISSFLGAALASGEGKHIKIDIVSKLIKNSRTKVFFQIIILIFSLIAIGFLIKSGLNFYGFEKDYPTDAFFGLKSSSLVLIIPFGFGLVFLKTLFSLLLIKRSHE